VHPEHIFARLQKLPTSVGSENDRSLLGILFTIKRKNNMDPRVKPVLLIVSSFIIIALILIINPFVIVTAGHRGVVLTWGAVSGKVLGEGLHFVTPIAQSVRQIEVRTVKLEATASAYSKDLQTVSTQVALNYHVVPESVNSLYQNIGTDYESRVLAPAIQEAVKGVTAKFTAQELIEKRAMVKDEIKMELTARLTKNFLIVDEFSLVNFEFSPAYEQAIEAKQVAQQNALAAENKLVQIKVEAAQRIAQATAEAEAIKIQAQAVTQQGGKEYVSLQWVAKWNGVLPTTMLGDSVPMVNIGK
jgi:regulator of protease activity HflC (stomatin/prohibitin superfamily)